MTLKEFIETFIEHNTLIRLLYKTKGGHETVGRDWDVVSMEHKVLNKHGPFRHYVNNEVVGVTDVVVPYPYSEAVNIVIKKDENQSYIEEAEDDHISCCEAV